MDLPEHLMTQPDGTGCAAQTTSLAFGAPGFITVLCGFITIVNGVFLLHMSRDDGVRRVRGSSTGLPRSMSKDSTQMELLPGQDADFDETGL